MALARTNLQGRKVQFREALVERIAIVGPVLATLRAKADGRMPAAFFLDQIARHFTAPEAHAQLATVADWGGVRRAVRI